MCDLLHRLVSTNYRAVMCVDSSLAPWNLMGPVFLALQMQIHAKSSAPRMSKLCDKFGYVLCYSAFPP